MGARSPCREHLLCVRLASCWGLLIKSGNSVPCPEREAAAGENGLAAHWALPHLLIEVVQRPLPPMEI